MPLRWGVAKLLVVSILLLREGRHRVQKLSGYCGWDLLNLNLSVKFTGLYRKFWAPKIFHWDHDPLSKQRVDLNILKIQSDKCIHVQFPQGPRLIDFRICKCGVHARHPPKTIIFVRASTPNIAVIYIIKYISVPTANSIFIIDGGAGVYVRHPLNICRCENQLVVA